MIDLAKRTLVAMVLGSVLVTLSAPGRADDLHSAATFTLALEPVSAGEDADLLQPVTANTLTPLLDSTKDASDQTPLDPSLPPPHGERTIGAADTAEARTIAAIQQFIDANSTGAP